MNTANLRTVIVGTGFSGLCMAIKLKQAGIDDFIVLEKAQEVGGVWRENTYPGAACDIPCEFYSYSFDMRTDWSRRYPPQPEIKRYMHSCAEKYGILPHIHFGVEVESATYSDADANWTIASKEGEQFTAQIFVSGVGQLSRPTQPKLKGAERFEGAHFHSAYWDENFEAAGKRIAVVGTGASAIQFIPELGAEAAQVDVYQRTPPYILPKPDRDYKRLDLALMKWLPGYKELNRFFWFGLGETWAGAFNRGSHLADFIRWVALTNLKRHVKDETLRAKLTPDYAIGCKRVLFSHNYYQAIAKGNIDIITQGVDEIDVSGVRDGEGQHREYDAIVYGTGFAATEFLAPMKISGQNGLDLNQAWADGAEAYKGVAVAGFPNFFMLYGPNTNLGSSSIIFMIEQQVKYIMQCVDKLASGKAKAVDVKPQPMREYNVDIQQKLQNSVWSAGCSSWYHTAEGKVTNNWPGYTRDYRRQMAVLDEENFNWISS